MKTETRIIIADDHPIFRSGLKQTIENNPFFKVISDAADGETALNSVLEQKPDIVVLDVNMPKMTGLQVAEELKRKQFPTRVVFLTMHNDEAMFNKAMSLEVKGYVLKDSAAVDIINCLNAVVAGQNFTSPAITTYLFKRTNSNSNKTGTFADLTANERAILKMIAEYKTSKEIGDELCISYRTVENYRTNICSKLDLHGSHALIKYALQNQDQL
jgi:DNA-binding NarL/FixJ family response regulator